MGRNRRVTSKSNSGKSKLGENKKTTQPIKKDASKISFNETFFRALIEHNSTAITLLNEIGEVIYDSPAASGMLGYSPTEWLGKSVFQLVHSDDLQKIHNLFEHLIKIHGNEASAIFRIRHKDNHWLWIDAVATNLLHESSVKAIVVNYRDITQIKRAEETLNEIEERFKQVWEVTTDAMALSDSQGIVIAANPAYYNLYGYKPEQVVGQSFAIIFPQDIREYIQTQYKQIFNSDVIPPLFESVVQHADGSERIVESRASFLTSAGQRIAMLSIIRDITERKAVDERIQNERNFSNHALESLPGVFYMYDKNRKFLRWNKNFETVTGYTAEEIANMSPLDFFAKQEQSLVDEKIEEVFRNGNAWVEAKFVSKDGKHTPYYFTGKLFESEGSTYLIGTGIDISDRKKIEDALASNEKNFRTLIENISDWFVKIDSEGFVTYVSDPMTRSLGYSVEEFIGIKIFDLIHPEDIPNTQNLFAKLMQDPTQVVSAQYKIKHKDSSWRWVESIGKNLLNDPDIGAIIGNFSDITDRKQAEQALISSEEQYRSLFEDSPIALWVEDFSEVKKRLDQLKESGVADIPTYIHKHPEFVTECANLVRILDVNQATLKLYHVKHKMQLLGSLNHNLIPISSEQFGYELKQLASGRLNFEYEGIDQTLAGEKINVNIHWAVSPGYEESLKKIIVSTIDITERKRAENKLHKQNQRLKVLREIDTAILATDSIESIGEAALSHIRELIGCERASLGLIDPENKELHIFGLSALGVTSIPKGARIPFELYPDWLSKLKKNEAVILQDLNTMTNLPPQVQAVVKDGLRSICILPLFSQGNLIGTFSMSSIISNFFDEEKINLGHEVANQVAIAITQNNLISALRELNTQLELRIAERTSQLHKTNVELEHANRTKDEFLANMSHELRTPLNSILGLSESMLEQYHNTLSENQQKSLQIIEASGKHLLDLINDVLDLAKIEAGKFDYYPQLIHVNDLCKSCLIFVKTQAMKKGITLTYEIEDTISDFSADPRRLKQILVNLLTNAVKFTPNDGHVTLKVNVKQDVIQFSVIDTGIGIALEDLRRLFTPFVQVESSLNRHFEGTGLGLALVQKLTDLHGGSVEVESEVGKGSRFTIKLPYQGNVLGQTNEAEKYISHPLNSEADFQPKTENNNQKILLVEDNQANILTIGEYLENHGYQIVIANDGVQAIEKANEINPDVILMDIQMPVMDGLEAIRRLRADPQFVSVPIIALTALAMPGDRERCFEAGASEYMSKPVNLKELRKVIENFLDSPK